MTCLKCRSSFFFAARLCHPAIRLPPFIFNIPSVVAVWLPLPELWVIKMIMNSITWRNWIFLIYLKWVWGGYNTIRWNVAGKERIVIWIITEANCCWPEWKEVKLYVIIHTKEREILASQLSHIILCQAWTQIAITLRGLYVHEWIALACTPLLPDHIHLDERAGGNTNWISLASLMCRFSCLVPSRWHKQHVTWKNRVGIKKDKKIRRNWWKQTMMMS